MTLECYRQLAQLLTQESVVLATVTSIKGSVPREVGAKMIVCAPDRIFYTIGGGAGEAKVIQQAAIVLQTGEKQLVEIDLTGAPQRETQGICGGKMQVWLERWSGEGAISLTQTILHRLKSGQSATLVTPFAADRSPYLITDTHQKNDHDNPQTDPPIPTVFNSKFKIQNSKLPTPSNAFVETLHPPPTLLIVGAGHVGEQLAKVAHLIEFQIVVQDDRPEWANSDRYPQAFEILNGSIAQVVDRFAAHENLYAALVTRGYQHDLAALDSLLRRELTCAYIGMIGSQKRVRQVYEALENAGIAKDKLRSIHAPIGLKIGALTPEEIAVSIGAELILVRRKLERIGGRR